MLINIQRCDIHRHVCHNVLSKTAAGLEHNNAAAAEGIRTVGTLVQLSHGISNAYTVL